jgi:hypothetical protein
MGRGMIGRRMGKGDPAPQTRLNFSGPLFPEIPLMRMTAQLVKPKPFEP